MDKKEKLPSVDELLSHLEKKTGIVPAVLKPRVCMLCEGKKYLMVLDAVGEALEAVECPNCHPAYA